MKNYKFEIFFYVFIVALLLLLVASARGQELSGGQFSITKTVVAGGGNGMSQNQTDANNTAGQTVAGSQSNGGNFTLYSGFWTPDDFTPTAATATIGGRIRAADGRGIKNVFITLTHPNGATQTTRSSSFGYYSFAEIPVGETYVVSVVSKRFSFSPSAQVINLTSDAMDVDFTADAPSQP